MALSYTSLIETSIVSFHLQYRHETDSGTTYAFRYHEPVVCHHDSSYQNGFHAHLELLKKEKQH